MDMKDFLSELEEKEGNLLTEAGKEGTQISDEYREAIERDLKVKSSEIDWIFKPDEYELAVIKHKGGGKEGKWSMVFFTEAEISDDEDEESLFGEGLNKILEASDKGTVVLDSTTGTYKDVVTVAVEIAKNKQFKKGATKQMIKQAIQKAK